VSSDDLLHLQIEGENLRLDQSDTANPTLVIEEPTRPAYLTVLFPPQSIAETCFFESSKVLPDGNPERPDTDPPTTPMSRCPGGVREGPHGRPEPAGVPCTSGTRIPFTTEGLLNWSKLQPSLHPLRRCPRIPLMSRLPTLPASVRPRPRTRRSSCPIG